VRRALGADADLVIAATQAQVPGGRLLLRNTDWELIRHCPMPLLLVKSQRPYSKPAILVAVDPFHARAKPARLDGELLTVGRDLAQATGGSVYAVHAYMPLISNVEGPLGEPLMWENSEVEAVHAQRVRSEFDRLVSKAGIPRARRLLMMGDVSGELAAAARRVKASIMVMGAVSRSGVRRLLIGNTAERLLDQLTCDALIIKPHGFKTSVPRRP
jgi:universal stress protein E